MFELFCDSDCDITPDFAKENNIHLISMPYETEEGLIYPYRDSNLFNFKDFYKSLSEGKVPHTSPLTVNDYIEYFEPVLLRGNDILYIHFSYAMSNTFKAMEIACDVLKERYPERKFYFIDTKSISFGSYAIIKEIIFKIKLGASIEEVIEYSEELANNFSMYFNVDDIKHLQRTGRINDFNAFLGGLFGVKPIISLDESGKMIFDSIGRGQMHALKKIVDYVEKYQVDIKNHPIIIGHTDVAQTAVMLAKLVKERLGEDVYIEFSTINPTAACHCGYGTVGIAFFGKKK